jgi:minor extracellular serine protease Vpr
MVGIDYRYPALDGCYDYNDPNTKCRVAFGYGFVGDDYDGKMHLPKEDNDLLDICDSHNTHVVDVVGADSEILRGIAPKVTFGAYSVSECTGVVTDDIIIAMME